MRHELQARDAEPAAEWRWVARWSIGHQGGSGFGGAVEAGSSPEQREACTGAVEESWRRSRSESRQLAGADVGSHSRGGGEVEALAAVPYRAGMKRMDGGREVTQQEWGLRGRFE